MSKSDEPHDLYSPPVDLLYYYITLDKSNSFIYIVNWFIQWKLQYLKINMHKMLDIIIWEKVCVFSYGKGGGKSHIRYSSLSVIHIQILKKIFYLRITQFYYILIIQIE